MNLQIRAEVGLTDEIAVLLKEYERLSPIFRERLRKHWEVRVTLGIAVDADTEGETIKMVMPRRRREDSLREFVEGILFECGNAERANVFKENMRRFRRTRTPAISMQEFAENKASAEADNFWEYAKGLDTLRHHNFVLSSQGRKQLGDVQGIYSLERYRMKFKRTQHSNALTASPVQKLPTEDMYAYMEVEAVPDLKQRNILSDVIIGGTRADLYRDVLLERTLFVNMKEGERVPVWCTILDIVNRVRTHSQGRWLKARGYDFSSRMVQLAMAKTLSRDTKATLNQRWLEIKNDLGLGTDVQAPHWLR